MRTVAGVTLAGALVAAVALALAPQRTDTPETDEQPFVEVGGFVSPEACIAELTSVVAVGPGAGFDRSTGPYAIAVGDIRAHRIRARDWGHEIEEWRCRDAAMSMRRWTHSMSDAKPITIEDIGRMNFPKGKE